MLINIYGNYKIVLLLDLSSLLFAFRHCSSNKHNITKQCNSIISSCVVGPEHLCSDPLLRLFTCLGWGGRVFLDLALDSTQTTPVRPHIHWLHWPKSLHTTLCAVHRIDDNFNYYHILQKGKHEARLNEFRQRRQKRPADVLRTLFALNRQSRLFLPLALPGAQAFPDDIDPISFRVALVRWLWFEMTISPNGRISDADRKMEPHIFRLGSKLLVQFVYSSSQ